MLHNGLKKIWNILNTLNSTHEIVTVSKLFEKKTAKIDTIGDESRFGATSEKCDARFPNPKNYVTCYIDTKKIRRENWI